MLQRFHTTIPSVTIDTTAAACEEIPFGSYAGGEIFFGTTGVSTLTWWVAEKMGGTYVAAYDEDGVAVTQTVSSSKAYPIPSALFGAAALKAVGDVAGTMAVSLKG